MPPRKKPTAAEKIAAVERTGQFLENMMPQQIDMFDNQSDDVLIAENFRLEDEVAAGAAKLAEWAKPKKERINAIEMALRARLLERGADSTKTDSGTAYFSNLMNPKIEDREVLFDFIADHWEAYGSDMLKLGAAVDGVRRYMDENEGKPPPGLTVSTFRRLNIKRS